MADHPIIRRLFHTWFLLRRPMTLGVRVLVEDGEGKVLLVRHTYLRGWYFPGGGVENGETQHQAAAKELREEAGIINKGTMELVGVFRNRSASRRDHVTLFRCRDWSQDGPFQPNREIAEAGFFDLGDLPDDTTPATLRRIAEIYQGESVSEYW